MAPERTAERAAVVNAGETTFVEFRLRGLGDIEGTVENEFTDALLKGVRLTLLDAAGGEVGESTTGDDGTYHFPDLAAGAYAVRLNLPKGYRSNEPMEKPVDVQVGTKGRADFLIHRHGTVQGRVLNETTGEPLGGITVELVDSTGAVVRQETTDTDGNYEFRELEVDRYTLRMAVPEHFAAAPDEGAKPAPAKGG